MNITCVGYYGQNKNNVGDQLFEVAYHHLFPTHTFSFVDCLTYYDLQKSDAIFIGGGSWLDQAFPLQGVTLEELLRNPIPIFYVSVGIEEYIHPDHLALFKKAKVLYIRNENTIPGAYKGISKITFAPDMVYSLPKPETYSESENKILFIPNASVVPTWKDPNWKHVAWNYFKSEFCQFVDVMQERGIFLDYLSLCEEVKKDSSVAHELKNSCVSKISLISDCFPDGTSYDGCLSLKEELFSYLAAEMSKYSLVISQRLHGSILAHCFGIPYLSISHHTKLDMLPTKLPYYGITKASLVKAFETKAVEALPDLSTIYKVVEKIEKQLNA